MIRSPIHRKVLSIAWPMIIAGASGPLLGIVDTAILGHLDSARYLSAVAVGASALTLVLWLLSFLRMGTTGLVARAFGQANRQQGRQLCRELLWQSLLLALALGVLLIAFQEPLLQLILWLLGPGEGIYEVALEYCQIRIWAAPATLCSYAAVGWLLGLQRARQTLLIMVATNAANIVLDFLLIIGLEMNSAGAAWASLLAEYLGLAVALWMVRRELKSLGGYVAPRQLLKLASYGQLLAVNRDLFLRTASIVFVFTFFTAQGARLGDDTVAANAVLLQLVLLVSYGLDGFAHAAESLSGHAIGGGKIKRFYAISRACGIWGVAIATGASLAYWLFRDVIVATFTDLPQIAELATRYYGWVVAVPLLATLCYTLDGILLGAGRTRQMRDTMFIALLAFLACWWLTLPWGNTGLWLAFCVFMACRSVLMSWAFGWLSKRGW
ncbi:MATE family efflux transporter [Porticoccus sp. W117]|uniref:MATE family efflux transporter n=1 Tax=Porticoccus sp. W117 TaxID=3054777 RepID=UPI0025926308|nr:MATE family efflux transporter [Porticoccus sp. W117]MDM3870822.1 MATE family efflux transporter [Porticoccus sp. W117]